MLINMSINQLEHRIQKIQLELETIDKKIGKMHTNTAQYNLVIARRSELKKELKKLLNKQAGDFP